MSNRIALIQEIEKKRTSKVICYLTGDRPQFVTNIGEDVIPILYRHLELIGQHENIDLFLYTRGGDMVVPIRIVKLIRNYCKKFSILVPYRCHSAGTLISLGADEIVMTKLAELTPVDPTSQNHQFNPKTQNPANPSQLVAMPVSVEDVRSYLSFAKDVLKATDEQSVELFSQMTHHHYADNAHLHPLALGNVYRVQKMIKIITERLLAFHFKQEKKRDVKAITEKIIKEITEDISVHNYPIYSDEAKSLGLNAQQASDDEEKLIWNLFEMYSDDMKLLIPFNVLDEMGANPAISANCHAAYIESVSAEDVFSFYYEIRKIQQANQIGVNLNMTKNQWEKVR